MSHSPRMRKSTRAARVALQGRISVMVLLENGRQFPAKLHQLSVTGGLLEVDMYLEERSKVGLTLPSATAWCAPARKCCFRCGVRRAICSRSGSSICGRKSVRHWKPRSWNCSGRAWYDPVRRRRQVPVPALTWIRSRIHSSSVQSKFRRCLQAERVCECARRCQSPGAGFPFWH